MNELSDRIIEESYIKELENFRIEYNKKWEPLREILKEMIKECEDEISNTLDQDI
jgi:hypothetical protein